MYIIINSSDFKVFYGDIFVTSIITSSLSLDLNLKNDVKYITHQIKVKDINDYKILPIDLFYFYTIVNILKSIIKKMKKISFHLIIIYPDNSQYLINYLLQFIKTLKFRHILDIQCYMDSTTNELFSLPARISNIYKRENTEILKCKLLYNINNLNTFKNFKNFKNINNPNNDNNDNFDEFLLNEDSPIHQDINSYNDIINIKLYKDRIKDLKKNKEKDWEFIDFFIDDDYYDDYCNDFECNLEYNIDEEYESLNSKEINEYKDS